MTPLYSELWLGMALDVVTAAQQRMSVHEFDRLAMLMPHIAGAGYIDRVRVLDQLINSRVVGIDDRHLTIGSIDGVDWILGGLQSGNATTWSIAEIVDRRQRVVRKFDADSLNEIGRIGEIAVMTSLRESLPESLNSKIRHVSQVDDTLGYDIVSPSVNSYENIQLLEVKTSVRPGTNFAFYISRNEFRVGENNPNWKIVCVQIVDGIGSILGHIPIEQIADQFPTDIDESVTWSSCRVTISSNLLFRGLP